jgi:hypothetical protein
MVERNFPKLFSDVLGEGRHSFRHLVGIRSLEVWVQGYLTGITPNPKMANDP